MTLYIRSRHDVPHARAFGQQAVSQCGQPLHDAVAITEAQALVWLEDARCTQCFHGWIQHQVVRRGAA